MKIVTDPDKMKTYAKIIKKENKLIGFIPTMGYFHEGHTSLIKTARKQSDIVIVSVFVNPIQFGVNEDFDSYPRDTARDEELARACGVDAFFCPKKEDMYPEDYSTYVDVEGLTSGLCGKSRPGHFRGVTTVVAKLFNIVRPDIAYFGQKDAQQAFVIKRMVEDLNMGITLKILPTVREKGGLAMSSRNIYLKGSERKDAAILYSSLKLAEELISSGERDAKKIIKKMRELISTVPAVSKIEYISIVDTGFLKDVAIIGGEVLIALAARVGRTRLIDNVILNVKSEKPENDHDRP
ncbi:MAG: pantoate--beta-alanine ligase [Candidatus Omnitrophica bacterium]|nr:pantoate--beta-alanine ligase [Candidatus Omnitrophota bacterium]